MVIAGAGKGLGLSLAKVFGQKGFQIALIARNEGKLQSMVAELQDRGIEEAYPVDPESPSYRFMGFVSTFEKEGFRYIKDAGTRRHVMICRC